jgi:hypothetical protein
MNYRRVVCTSAVAAAVLSGGYRSLANAQPNAAPVTQAHQGYFPVGATWTEDVTTAAVDSQSSSVINWLAGAGGWGTGRMHVDFAIRVLQADDNSPSVPFRRGKQFFTPDSDSISTIPLPEGGGMEGQPSYTCPVAVEDCHLIVLDRNRNKLYEAYQANYAKGKITATFVGVWDLNRVYPPSGRGEQCTSADAAGFPIAPLLFNADELSAGSINHAIRFILPNDRIREGVFVPPATHAGGPSGPDSAPPYGVHLRLKGSYDISQLKPAAQVVARAMQKYGMFLADGGNVALTAQNDADTRTKYADVDFGPNDLSPLHVNDFEMLETGKPVAVTYDCVRNR